MIKKELVYKNQDDKEYNIFDNGILIGRIVKRIIKLRSYENSVTAYNLDYIKEEKEAIAKYENGNREKQWNWSKEFYTLEKSKNQITFKSSMNVFNNYKIAQQENNLLELKAIEWLKIK